MEMAVFRFFPRPAAVGIGIGPDVIRLRQHVQAEDIGMIGRAARPGMADDPFGRQDGGRIPDLHAFGNVRHLVIGIKRHLVPVVQKGLQTQLFEPGQLPADPQGSNRCQSHARPSLPASGQLPARFTAASALLRGRFGADHGSEPLSCQRNHAPSRGAQCVVRPRSTVKTKGSAGSFSTISSGITCGPERNTLAPKCECRRDSLRMRGLVSSR